MLSKILYGILTEVNNYYHSENSMIFVTMWVKS